MKVETLAIKSLTILCGGVWGALYTFNKKESDDRTGWERESESHNAFFSILNLLTEEGESIVFLRIFKSPRASWPIWVSM